MTGSEIVSVLSFTVSVLAVSVSVWTAVHNRSAPYHKHVFERQVDLGFRLSGKLSEAVFAAKRLARVSLQNVESAAQPSEYETTRTLIAEVDRLLDEADFLLPKPVLLAANQVYNTVIDEIEYQTVFRLAVKTGERKPPNRDAAEQAVHEHGQHLTNFTEVMRLAFGIDVISNNTTKVLVNYHVTLVRKPLPKRA